MITVNCCVMGNKKLFRLDLYCHNMPIRCIFSPDDDDKTRSKQMYLFKIHTGDRKKKGRGILLDHKNEENGFDLLMNIKRIANTNNTTYQH